MTQISMALTYHLQHLADSSYNNWGRGGHAVPHWLEVLLIPLFKFGVPIGVVTLGLYMFIRAWRIPMRGPTLRGTAEIVSLRRLRFAVGTSGFQRKPYRIGLRVQIPGREPYDVTIRQNIEPWMLGFATQAGATVPVQVQAANPQNVRIYFNQPFLSRDLQSGGGFPGVDPHNVWVTYHRPPINTADPAAPQTARTDLGSPPTFAAAAAAIRKFPSASPVQSASDLLSSGQRVRGVLMSFADIGTTPRSVGRTPSRPELIDAPHHLLEVNLQLPGLAAVTARNVQPVPLVQVPNLAAGRELACVVDPTDPTNRFVVDWASGDG
jgi:hypothetical protein